MAKTILATTLLISSAASAFAHAQPVLHVHDYTVGAIGAVAIAAASYFVWKAARDRKI